MTKEELQTRLESIDRMIQQHIGNINKLEGHKSEIVFWLESINKAETAVIQPEVHEGLSCMDMETAQ